MSPGFCRLLSTFVLSDGENLSYKFQLFITFSTKVIALQAKGTLASLKLNPAFEVGLFVLEHMYYCIDVCPGFE